MRSLEISMLEPSSKKIDVARFSDRQTALIRAAARDPRVDRMFVNAVIKRALCRRVKTDRGWLRKVVPWYGHVRRGSESFGSGFDVPRQRPSRKVNLRPKPTVES